MFVFINEFFNILFPKENTYNILLPFYICMIYPVNIIPVILFNIRSCLCLNNSVNINMWMCRVRIKRMCLMKRFAFICCSVRNNCV